VDNLLFFGIIYVSGGAYEYCYAPVSVHFGRTLMEIRPFQAGAYCDLKLLILFCQLFHMADEATYVTSRFVLARLSSLSVSMLVED
jgi:hypothetical protein